MYVDIYETVSRTYRIDSDTLEEFKKEGKELTEDNLINYVMENYYFDDFLLDEEVDDLKVDKRDFSNFKAND